MLFSSNTTINTSNHHQPYLRVAFTYIDISNHLPLIHQTCQTTPTRDMFDYFKTAIPEKASPPSLIDFATITRDGWMANNSLEGDLTQKSLFGAIYPSGLVRQTTEAEGTSSDQHPTLQLTYQRNIGETRYKDKDPLPTFVAGSELKSVTARPYPLPQSRRSGRSSKFSCMQVLGGQVKLDSEGVTNFIAFQPEHISGKHQTGKIIHGFPDQEFHEFWKGVETITPSITTTEPDGFPPLSQTGAKIVARLSILSSPGSRTTNQILPTTDGDGENASVAGSSSTQSFNLPKSLLD